MSIDWEELLDASGDELQDAYDDLCYDALCLEADPGDEPWDNDDPLPAHQEYESLSHIGDPIPVELHARMAELHMIQKGKGCLWEPSAYGRSLGITDGCLPPAEDGRPCHTFFIPDEQRGKLDEALAWSQTHQQPEERLSWARSMERVSRGLSRSDVHAANVVRAFGAMPLAQYLSECPHALRFLCDNLGLDENDTYQEAADRVYRSFMEPGRSDDLCAHLISSLTRPVYLAMSTMKPPTF